MRLVPSGDHASPPGQSGLTGPGVAKTVLLPPPASMTTMDPSCGSQYAIFVPSGDHTAPYSIPGALVSWRMSVPSARTV